MSASRVVEFMAAAPVPSGRRTAMGAGGREQTMASGTRGTPQATVISECTWVARDRAAWCWCQFHRCACVRVAVVRRAWRWSSSSVRGGVVVVVRFGLSSCATALIGRSKKALPTARGRDKKGTRGGTRTREGRGRREGGHTYDPTLFILLFPLFLVHARVHSDGDQKRLASGPSWALRSSPSSTRPRER